jgi:hypothetical protein
VYRATPWLVRAAKQARGATLASKAQLVRPVVPVQSCAVAPVRKALRVTQASKVAPDRQALAVIARRVMLDRPVRKAPLAPKGTWDEVAFAAPRLRVRLAPPAVLAVLERRAQPGMPVLKAAPHPVFPGQPARPESEARQVRAEKPAHKAE